MTPEFNESQARYLQIKRITDQNASQQRKLLPSINESLSGDMEALCLPVPLQVYKYEYCTKGYKRPLKVQVNTSSEHLWYKSTPQVSTYGTSEHLQYNQQDHFTAVPDQLIALNSAQITILTKD